MIPESIGQAHYLKAIELRLETLKQLKILYDMDGMNSSLLGSLINQVEKINKQLEIYLKDNFY